MEHFHPSALAHGTSFRESLRSKPGFTTEHLDRAQAVLNDALAKHGDEHLTAKNFSKVMEDAQRDSRWAGTYSSGAALEGALKEHLKISD